MAIRQPFNDATAQPDPYADLVSGLPLPSAPALPMGDAANAPSQSQSSGSDASSPYLPFVPSMPDTGGSVAPVTPPDIGVTGGGSYTPPDASAPASTPAPSPVVPTTTPTTTTPTTQPATGTGATLNSYLTAKDLADNAPYGVTLAGWSPQYHANANLTDPANAKYAAWNYLVQNKVDPNDPAWASKAATALNQQVPGNMFSAGPDGQLYMGDEYIGVRPRGYGMAPGTFNPSSNAQEFLYGGYPGANPADTSTSTGAGTGTGTGTSGDFPGPGGGLANPPPGSGGATTKPSPTPAPSTTGLTLQDLIGTGAGLTPPGGNVSPLTQVGQDPLSQAISGGTGDLLAGQGFTGPEQSVFATLSDLIGRTSGQGSGLTPAEQTVQSELQNIIGAGGSSPANDQIVQQQLESARESEAQAQTSMLNDARAELASRGLVSEPGVPQGSEADAISRIQQSLAPGFAGAVRDINTGSIQAQNNRLIQALLDATSLTGTGATTQSNQLISALSSITGLSQTGANTFLNTLGSGTQRQIGLATIALDTLGQNQQWNQFLAQFGLNRDALLYQIQNGQTSLLGPLLSLFSQLTGISAGGFIGQ